MNPVANGLSEMHQLRKVQRQTVSGELRDEVIRNHRDLERRGANDIAEMRHQLATSEHEQSSLLRQEAMDGGKQHSELKSARR